MKKTHSRWSHSAEVRDSAGLGFIPTKVGKSLPEYDIIVVPGGFGSRQLVDDANSILWLQTAKSCKLKVSVCAGSLLLGTAGFLKGEKATTHPNALDDLRKFCRVVEERIVGQGDVITARLLPP